MKELYISIGERNTGNYTKYMKNNIHKLLKPFGIDTSLFSIFEDPEDIKDKNNQLFVYYKKGTGKGLRKTTIKELEEIVNINKTYEEYLELSKQIFFPIIEDKKIGAMSYQKFKESIGKDYNFSDFHFKNVIYNGHKHIFIGFHHNKNNKLCIILMNKKDNKKLLVEDIENIEFIS